MSNHEAGGDDAARCYPSQITDAMWAVLKPLLPVRDLRRGGRPRVYGDRPVLDAIFYVLRSWTVSQVPSAAQVRYHR